MFFSEEKRLYPRKKVFLPAFVVLTRSAHVHPATIHDISCGGLRVCVSKESGVEMRHFDPQTHVNVLLAMPDEAASLAVKCMPSRIHDKGEEIEVGAFFTDFDEPTFLRLHNFMVP